jgi:putative transposase
VRTFNTVEDLRRELLEFRESYNVNWLSERHGFRPLAAVPAAQLLPAALVA